ncbi:MAG: GYD domain-containing protein [Verrucomicrobia bacterium]|nr:GYD domain-containing protein [Verrucomicrobiota bacterium]
MPKYLTMVSYTPEGLKGLVKEGGTARRATVEKMLQNLGGRLEGFYFAFGDNDAYVISEGPDNATAAAISLAITTGAIRTKTIVLLTPEEVDQAVKIPVEYRPPGE